MPSHPTEPTPTAIGVAPGRAKVGTTAIGGALPAGPVLGPLMNPPDKTLAPMTTTMTATPDRAPSGIDRRRDEAAPRERLPRDADSPSMAADVRAHRSRGGTGW